MPPTPPNRPLTSAIPQPYTPTLVPDPSDILNIGSFSDSVFNPVAVLNPVAAFLTQDIGQFVAEVQVVEL